MEKVRLQHLGLIPDGVRRWAKLNQRDLVEAYSLSAEKLLELLPVGFEQGVMAESVYMLSVDNLLRTQSEINPVIDLQEKFVREQISHFCVRWRCSVHHVGRTDLLPISYAHVLNDLTQTFPMTTSTERRLYLLVAYSPWDELRDAINRYGSVESEKQFWVPEPVDLIIRTGYGSLLSNFLPLQSGYAQLHVISKLFNDVTPDDILSAIDEYRNAGERLRGH